MNLILVNFYFSPILHTTLFKFNLNNIHIQILFIHGNEWLGMIVLIK